MMKVEKVMNMHTLLLASVGSTHFLTWFKI